MFIPPTLELLEALGENFTCPFGNIKSYKAKLVEWVQTPPSFLTVSQNQFSLQKASPTAGPAAVTEVTERLTE